MSTTTEHLTTGWEADVDPADTVVRRFLLHWAATCDCWATAAGGRVIRTPDLVITDYGRPSGLFNAVVLLRPFAPDEVDQVLGVVEDQLEGGRGSVELWSLWPTPDLRVRGWELVGHPPLMARPPGRLAGIPDPGPVDVREVRDPAALADWERVAVEGFPLDELRPFRPRSIADPVLLDDPRVRLWVGHQDGRPVSLGTLFVEDDLASFTLGVTRPEARGHGHWNAHAAHRIAAAPDLWFTGVFSDFSRPLAERIGFLPVVRFTLWSRPRP